MKKVYIILIAAILLAIIWLFLIIEYKNYRDNTWELDYTKPLNIDLKTLNQKDE